MIEMFMRWISIFIALGFGSIAFSASPEEAVGKAHQELWRRFVDEHGLILDYVGLKGAADTGGLP